MHLKYDAPLFLFNERVQNMEFNTYVYDGPVLIFGKCVANRWKSKTIASSESKARSNLAYQFKKQANLVTGFRVELPGKLKIID